LNGVRLRAGSCEIDSDRRTIVTDGQERHVPKAFDLLMALIEARPKVLRKAALLARVWPGTFVDGVAATDPLDVSSGQHIVFGSVRARAILERPETSTLTTSRTGAVTRNRTTL
jgi:hypothetical protein